ncbi:MAG TPA: hypothetical protein VJA85_09480 [Candidatus Limnocylindria bacterium]|nr:hypothetical protein [Candidatus Limnocylindria bacterium]
MAGRTILGVVAGLLLVGLLAGGAIAVYNAGVAAGLAADGALPALPFVGYPYYGHGIGFFGVLAWIFGIFLVFGLLRAALGARHGGHGHWGGGPGWKAGMHGPWMDDERMRSAVADMHRRLHEEPPSDAKPSS